MTESFQGFKKAAESFRVEHGTRRSRVDEYERVMLRYPLPLASRLAAGVVFALEQHRQRMWEAQRAADAARFYTEVGLFVAFYGCLSRMADVLGEQERDPFDRLDPLFEGSIDEERARCVIRAYFGEVRRAPDLWLITIEKLLDDPRVGETEQYHAVAALTGRVRALTAYERMRDLQAALDREGTDLLDELPMAVIEALKEREPHERLEEVRNNALNALRREFKTRGLQVHLWEETRDDDAELELAAFALHEELKRLIDEAGLSPNERQVLLMSLSFGNKQIAESTGRAPSQIGVEKKRAMEKMRRLVG